MGEAQHLLDQVQSPARIDALAAEPGAYAEHLAAELAEIGDPATLAELEARDGQLRQALAQLEVAIERIARIRIDHALTDDAGIGAPTRKVFAATIVSYAGRLAVLEARARDVAARGGAADPTGVAARVCDEARAVLALRGAVRAEVLALVARLAEAAAPIADRRARDRNLDEPVRRRWSAARRDLEAIAGRPEAIAIASMAERLAAWPEQLDEPEPEREPTLAELIELD